ncbi:hypothetical protein FA15DRAFT_756826 [Coprinopsis marcescibilis]|uniref:Methyltransferase n=1 Tax=Coprinopsis marcescibilis TaxID=230819 RepID=A0A5C3KTP1_COPMA|nr:hypothetical protein FA15DRAFT_756826 [Coprinopsis marcescibilis]
MSGNPCEDTVVGTIHYFVPPEDGSVAYQSSEIDPETGDRKRNFSRQGRPCNIENVRGKLEQFTLDAAGFQFFNRPAAHSKFEDDKDIVDDYYPESVEFIKEVTGAVKVVIFDHTIRRRRPGIIDDGPTKRQPVMHVHVDQTAAAAVARVRRHLPTDEANRLLQGRFQILNLWRPVKYTADDYPLALCDFRSVDPKEDPSLMKVIYPNFQGETLGVKYNADHKWKYLRTMTTDEVVLFKCYDSSSKKGVATFAPHSAFIDPTTPPDALLRESIELRALVFYK